MCEEFDTIIDNATQTLNDAHGTLTHFHKEVKDNANPLTAQEVIQYAQVCALIGIGNALTAQALAAKQQADYYTDDEEEQNDISPTWERGGSGFQPREETP